MRGECRQATVQTPQCERGKSPGRSPPDPPYRKTQKTRRVKRRKEEERGSSHGRLSSPYHTLQKIIYSSARLCRLRLHSLSEYSSKQENEKKGKAKDSSEQESNARLEKVRGKAVGHRFLILTTGEATGSGDSQAREEQSPSEFAMRGECRQAAVQTPQRERGKWPGRSPPDPPYRQTQKTKRVKRRKKEQRGSSHSRLSPPYNTLQKIIYNSTRSCRLRLHSLSEYSSKQENEKKRKAKDRSEFGSEQESNSRLEKARGKAVEHRFLILTAGEVDRLGRLSGKGRAVSFGVCKQIDRQGERGDSQPHLLGAGQGQVQEGA
jgi:hypothetical protein